MLKPRLGFAGRHIYRCADADELAFFRRYSPAESVVQQALPGLSSASTASATSTGGRSAPCRGP